MRNHRLKHGLLAACLLAVAAVITLPSHAFVGGLRGPKADGELALPGLSAPVRVLRDEHGIPYIFAANTPDLIRAQGFVTAQDRLFQLEGYRALANGRLAEAVGEAGLGNDRHMRLLGALTPFMGGFDVEFFASMRLVADLGDDEKIEVVLAGGVVDRQFHPHQKDQLPAWSEGRLLPWWFAPQQVEAHAQKRQQLVPR